MEETDIQNPDDIVITDTYQWYEPGYRYPVLETINSYRKQDEESIPLRQASYIYHPAEQRLFSFDEANEKVLAKKEKSKSTNKTNIAVEAFELTLTAYPNPVVDKLNLDLVYPAGETTRLSLFSLEGKELYRLEADPDHSTLNTRIDMQDYVKGSYIVKVSSGDKHITEKIVKH